MRIGIVGLVLVIGARAQAQEFSRIELLLNRGERVVEPGQQTERLRLRLNTGSYALRAGKLDGTGQDRALARELQDLLQLHAQDRWASPYSVGGSTFDQKWKYALRVYRGAAKTPSKVLEGTLPGPRLAELDREVPPVYRIVLSALLRLRTAALAQLAPKVDGARRDSLRRLSAGLFKPAPAGSLLFEKVVYDEDVPGRQGEYVDAVRVFKDGWIEQVEGTTRTDLKRTLRYRVAASRLERLTAALATAPPAVSASAKRARHVIYTAPTVARRPLLVSSTIPVPITSDRPQHWPAVDRALDELLRGQPLRGFFGPEGLHKLDPKILQGSRRARLERFSAFGDLPQSPWPDDLGGVVLDLTGISVATIRELTRALPQSVPVLLIGHYRRPIGQRPRYRQGVQFVVTGVKDLPRAVKGQTLEATQTQKGIRFTQPGSSVTVVHSKWLAAVAATLKPGDRVVAAGWVRIYGPTDSRLEVSELKAVVSKHVAKTTLLEHWRRAGYGADLHKDEVVAVTGALQRGQRTFLEIGQLRAGRRVVISTAVDLRAPSAGARHGEPLNGARQHLERRLGD